MKTEGGGMSMGSRAVDAIRQCVRARHGRHLRDLDRSGIWRSGRGFEETYLLRRGRGREWSVVAVAVAVAVGVLPRARVVIPSC
jgi:hypothetical protein